MKLRCKGIGNEQTKKSYYEKGITYCKECHLFKVHRYKYKEEK